MKFSFRFPATAASLATRAYRRRSLLLACVGIAVLPLAWQGTSCGHDFDFHLQSWMETLRHWHAGVFYPRWDASANYGAGEPRFIFYPPLSWMVGALLGAVLPWTWTPLVFTLLCLLGLGASFFAMAREWMPEDNAALAACLCVLNPYLLFTAYERTAYGELFGAMCIPLLILFGLRKQPSLLPLSLVVAAMWLTDAPVAVMGCYTLALLVLVTSIRDRSFALVRRSLGAVPLGIGLAAFYLVPAIHQQPRVEIARAVNKFMLFSDSFLFGYTADPDHNAVLRTASWIAVAMILATVSAAWLSRKSRNTLWMPLSAAAAVLIFLHFRVSTPVWRLAPAMKFLPFPWRWQLVLAVLFAALAGLALRSEATTRRAISLRAICLLLLTALMAGLAAAYFRQPCDDEDNVQAQIAALSGGGVEGTDEYTLKDTDAETIQRDLPPVRVLNAPDANEPSDASGDNPEWQQDKASTVPAQIRIESWRAEHIAVTITAERSAFAVFRLVNYPAWRVLLNGKNVLSIATRGDGLVTLPIAAGENRIDIRYQTAADAWIGRVVSLIALAVLVLMAVRGKKERRVQVS